MVDDHAIVRQGLERLFDTAADIDLVGMASDGGDAIDLIRRVTPDVVLMDLSMPGMDGVEATRKIVAEHPEIHLVVLTSFGDEARVVEALNAGAQGYLLKHIDPDDLITAVRAANAGDAPLDPRAGRVLIEQRRSLRPDGEELTRRETEVLGLVGEGLANKVIARRLGIGERTVKAHLTSIFQRLGVTDRVQAALWAHEHFPGKG